MLTIIHAITQTRLIGLDAIDAEHTGEYVFPISIVKADLANITMFRMYHVQNRAHIHVPGHVLLTGFAIKW